MASITTSGRAVAGDNLTLVCSAVKAENVTGDIDVQWIGPGGEYILSTESVVVGVPITSGDVTSLVLQFTTLHTSNGGEYTCQCDLILGGETQSVSVTSDVIVQGICIGVSLFCSSFDLLNSCV